MIEGSDMGLCFPVEKLGTPQETGIDLIRVCIWKRLMREHIEYCKSIATLGYKVSIQPTAIHQYNNEEFKELIQLVNEIAPYSFYLVDTWGTESPDEIINYAVQADRYLLPDIKLGYHGHNNKMQALSCVEAILKLGLKRDVCIDATVMGMGRGAGNLQTEVVMDFLNRRYKENMYDCKNVISLYDKYIKHWYEKSPWGYSIYHFISGELFFPQDFASYFKEHNYSIQDYMTFMDSLEPYEKVVFKKQLVEKN
jgi:4-hydroxy 2-oxovalerate aldolase